MKELDASLTSETIEVGSSCCSSAGCCAPKDPIVRASPKVGRNDPCPCGSERKFKKCCGRGL